MASTFFILVADRGGFVGAFASEAEAQEALRPFVGFPFLGTRYPRADPGSKTLWVLPYCGTGASAIAFASDDRAAVEAVQADLLRVELTYGDDIKYWEHEFGTVAAPALRRFEDARGVLDAAEAEAKAKAFGDLASGVTTPQPPPSEAPRRINRLESVIPKAFDPAPYRADGAGPGPGPEEVAPPQAVGPCLEAGGGAPPQADEPCSGAGKPPAAP